MAIYTDVTEITAWQLAHQLNLRVDLFLLSPDFRHHYEHVDQLNDAARSGPRNIEEGFVTDRRTFADRLRLAKGAQVEVVDLLRKACEQRLITTDELIITRRLARRSLAAANVLIRSLEATSADEATPETQKTPAPIRSAPRGWD